ncbi:hypothetical protein ACIQVK_51070 [Streptomyces sp. NPDC090493]|uniref:hypothetical protein n=1 Tax=Streptomyces sp. NPDC090493 TaxID=3365964 RepID=UPI003802268F
MPDSASTTSNPRGAEPSRRTRRVYLIIGLALGFVWTAHSAEPPWEHAARTLGLMLVILPVATRLLRRRQERTGVQLPELRHVNVFAAKIALVAAALGAEWLLDKSTDHADRFVAMGIAVVVASIGPHLTRFFVKQEADRAAV